jgi:hypothetical protein
VRDKKTNKSSRKKQKSSFDPSKQIISKSKDGTKERVYRKCLYTGCENIAKKWGVCYKHGAPRSLRSCKGGTRVNENEEKESAKDTTAKNDSNDGVECEAPQPPKTERRTPPHHAEGYDARAVIVSATAGGGGGEIEIDTRNLQADVSCAAAPRSPSLRLSAMALTFSDDDEEIIGALILMSSRMGRLASVNDTNGAL